MPELRVNQGEKVDLFLGRGPYYRTVVDELPDDKTILVPLPTYRGIPIILSRDQEIKMYFYRPNGRYVQNVKVIGFVLEGSIRMVRLLELTEPDRQQRRDMFRVTTMLRAYLRPIEIGETPTDFTDEEIKSMEEAPTFNISATGIAIRTKGEYEVGDRLFIRVFLAWPQQEPEPINIVGEVRQVNSVEQDHRIKQLGIMFMDISEEMSEHIGKFVLIEEQRRAKQQRLVTG